MRPDDAHRRGRARLPRVRGPGRPPVARRRPQPVRAAAPPGRTSRGGRSTSSWSAATTWSRTWCGWSPPTPPTSGRCSTAWWRCGTGRRRRRPRSISRAATRPGSPSALRDLFALGEAYPTLRADQHFLALQQQLAETEDRIAAARRFYNGNVRALNTRVEMFPSSVVASLWHVTPAGYFLADEAQVRAAPLVPASGPGPGGEAIGSVGPRSRHGFRMWNPWPRASVDGTHCLGEPPSPGSRPVRSRCRSRAGARGGTGRRPARTAPGVCSSTRPARRSVRPGHAAQQERRPGRPRPASGRARPSCGRTRRGAVAGRRRAGSGRPPRAGRRPPPRRPGRPPPRSVRAARQRATSSGRSHRWSCSPVTVTARGSASAPPQRMVDRGGVPLDPGHQVDVQQVVDQRQRHGVGRRRRRPRSRGGSRRRNAQVHCSRYDAAPSGSPASSVWTTTNRALAPSRSSSGSRSIVGPVGRRCG